MSFVVKAVKKVFKKVKKFVKKVVRSDWFKVVAIAALTVFTAGVAAGGWAAFTGVNSIGSFFGAVGSTMANGWTAIGNWVSGQGFGLGGGEAATGAMEVGAGAGPEWAGGNSITGGNNLVSGEMFGVDAGSGVTASSRIATASDIAAAGKPLGDITLAGATPISTAAAKTAADMTTTGFWEGAKAMSKKFLGKLGETFVSDSVSGTMLRQGIFSGISSYYAEKDRERQEFYFRNRTVWGNAAFGSEGNSLIMPTAKKKSIFERTPQEEQAVAQQQQQQAATAEQTFGPNNLLTPQQQVQNPAQQVQRSAQAQMPQPTQPPPTNRPPQDRGLLFTPENEGIYNAG